MNEIKLVVKVFAGVFLIGIGLFALAFAIGLVAYIILSCINYAKDEEDGFCYMGERMDEDETD